MAEQTGNRFLNKYAGNGWQRFGRWVVDRLPGDQLAPDGTLDNTAVMKGLGIAGTAAALNMVAPGVGTLFGRSLASKMDTGSFIPMGTGPAAYLFGHGQQQILGPALANSQQSMQAQILAKNPELAGLIGQSPVATAVGPVTRQQIGFPSNEMGQYAQARPAMNMPTMPTVQAETPWTGSLAGSNPFGGRYGGNLGFTSSGPRAYGQAAGSFTPNGASVVQVAGNGWSGQDAAMGFGIGPSSGRGVGAPNLIARYSRV